MPFNVRIKLILYISLPIILTFYFLYFAFVNCCFLSAFLIASTFLLILGVYFLFTYYPRFDFSKDYKIKEKEILLSFDDGISANCTDKILNILKKYKIQAVFFSIGKKLEKNINLAERLINDGHVLANHTYSHKKLHKASMKEIDTEILRTQNILKIIYSKSNKKVPLIFRAPHGFKSLKLKKYLKKNNYKLIAWTKGVWDTAEISPEWIYRHSIKHNKKGQILLLHDGLGLNNCSKKQKNDLLEALPLIIETYLSDSYKFVSVFDILKKEVKLV